MRISPKLLVPWGLRWQGRMCGTLALFLIAVIGYLNPEAQNIDSASQEAPIYVIVAREDILPGEELTPEKIIIEPFFKNDLPPDPFYSFGSIKGAKSKSFIPYGYPISKKLVEIN